MLDKKDAFLCPGHHFFMSALLRLPRLSVRHSAQIVNLHIADCMLFANFIRNSGIRISDFLSRRLH
jgi:hypothetical protein